jgi:hypothetical protein
VAQKRSAKLIMQQRKNIFDAKAKAEAKLVDDVKGLASDAQPESMPPSAADRFDAHLNSLAASDNRPQHFETGATEHLPDNVISFADFMERKKNIKE